MTEVIEPTGQVTTPTGPDVGELQRRLTEATEQIDRMRGTQSSNDRALTVLRAQVKQYETQVAQYQVDIAARDTDLVASHASLEEYKTKDAELEQLKLTNTALTAATERLSVVAEYAAKHPVVGLLSSAGALPVADDIEGFRKGLDFIVAGMADAAVAQATSIVAGAKPNPPQTASPEADDLYDQGMKMIMAQNPEGIELVKQAQQMRLKRQE